MFEGPEKKFQKHIADFLVREHGFVVLARSEITDADYYFAEEHLWNFLHATQAETVARLEEDYGSDSRDEIFKALRDELERRPLWTILRTGLSVRGHEFKLYFPRPRSRESAASDLYGENRICLVPELVIGEGMRPDFVFFLNGLPIVTMELKHERNQNVHDAVAQYASRDHHDRIFQLPFLHIAADTTDVQVATDPRSEENFRWFNSGLTNKALTEGEYPVEFLYREVLSKDSLLESVSFYLVRAPKQEAREDRPERPASTIFPRYHQRRCVEKIADKTLDHFAEHGHVGRKFLVNHSAGSGKTLTMCWLADRLHSLYKPGTTEKVVNMVFLLTDRKALDKNVREDMEKFSHLSEVVRFAKRSGDLARFLKNRDQIIVTTQQKFRYILKKIAEDDGLKSLRVAFLIDEAHRSQEGAMATAIRTPFRDEVQSVREDLPMVAESTVSYGAPDEDEVPEPTPAEERAAETPDAEDAQEQEDPQDRIGRVIREHDLNQLFVAFTATPSAGTIQLFGEAEDTYTEAEAIAEDYIVDVVQSIISYKTLYHLRCPIVPLPEEEKLYPAGVVSKALKNVAYQDSELIQYKAEVMLRIFEENVKPLIGGRAKAMIVATSRVAGLEYFRVIKKKLEERGADYGVLYAFSDFVHPKSKKVILEHELNGLNEGESIEDRFEEDSYRLMIVASKFQTGFDQPLLGGMFLDKAVADRNAVQTLSRLNRCHPDKQSVVVVDFTNNARTILKAFRKYRHGSAFDPDEPNAEKCLDLYEEILGQGVFTRDDVPPVIALVAAGNDPDLQSAAARLRERFQEKIENPDKRKSFVHLLAKFVRSYYFLSNFFRYEQEVTDFVVFCEVIGPQLIKAGSVSELMKQVQATVVSKAAVSYEGEIGIEAGGGRPKVRKGGGGGGPPPRKVSVQDMIRRIRDSFEISAEEELHIREVSDEKLEDESIRETVLSHREDHEFLENVFKGQVNAGIQDAYALRELYEQLGDPKYTEKGAIFDIMAFTVIEKGRELAEAS